MNKTRATIEVVYIAKIYDDNGVVIDTAKYDNYRDAREFVKGSLGEIYREPQDEVVNWSRYTKYLGEVAE